MRVLLSSHKGEQAHDIYVDLAEDACFARKHQGVMVWSADPGSTAPDLDDDDPYFRGGVVYVRTTEEHDPSADLSHALRRFVSRDVVLVPDSGSWVGVTQSHPCVSIEWTDGVYDVFSMLMAIDGATRVLVEYSYNEATEGHPWSPSSRHPRRLFELVTDIAKSAPRWGLYPWFEVHGVDLIHPDDVDVVRALQPSGKVLRLMGENDGFLELGYGSTLFRGRPKLFVAVGGPVQDIGAPVTLTDGCAAEVVGITWHHKRGEVMYQLQIEGKVRSKRYWASDFS